MLQPRPNAAMTALRNLSALPYLQPTSMRNTYHSHTQHRLQEFTITEHTHSILTRTMAIDGRTATGEAFSEARARRDGQAGAVVERDESSE